MFGRVEFPRIEDRPLFLTLGPHAFIWFALEADPSGRGIEVRGADERAPTLTVAPRTWTPLLARLRARRADASMLPGYLRARRWFRSKARRIKSVALHDAITVPLEASRRASSRSSTSSTPRASRRRYVLPLALGAGGTRRTRSSARHPRR